MKIYTWSIEKNNLLKAEREISFEEIVAVINQAGVVEVYDHPNQKKYPNQKIYEVEIDNYIYLVPFIETEFEYFLKTIIPSRKATQKHRNKK